MAAKSSAKLGSLEQESMKRQERIKILRSKVENVVIEPNAELQPRPTFRSYKPNDELMQGNTLETQSIGDIESEIKDQLDLLNTPIVIEDIDIANLAPRKPDWDLKRDVAKKLDKLERITQKTIAELIRDRLKTNQDDIFQVVSVGTEMRKTKSN